ncbi:MAG TPA: hypothetical protein DCQ28_08245 [Bacteroidetes bacterium]|nr:hypothetical protein [Bacteroidota bacterium]
MNNKLLSQDFAAVNAKETIKILVTDSGLGGLAVCADVEKKIREYRSYRTATVIFCNALAEKGYGYNSMKTKEEKLKVFSSALNGMTQWYSPDIILIACNTLSVLYAETDYARTAALPVISIVDIGVEMILKELTKDDSNSVLIFGTPTTITANKHKEGLMANGISGDRIVTQACTLLESEIQENPSSTKTKNMIEQFTSEAFDTLTTTPKTVVVALCCTHYGYSIDEFKRAIGSRAEQMVIVNPNDKMSDVLFLNRNRFATVDVTVSVVSRVEITAREKQSLASLLAKKSPATAAAMEQYLLKRDLFEFNPQHNEDK